ncbi:MAG: phosphoribosyl-AMP cyclohydrolase [Anaerolineae bacterium]|nr:phosphoribosyl-AMP cyclohydrolase [Anaerolineae bacterium]
MTIIDELNWNDQGLLPAIVQDSDTDRVLMLAWVNEAALRQTFLTGEVHFWSRSRSELWHKGATSGNTMVLTDAHYDCDRDALLLRVVPRGPACHTGSTSCFFNPLTFNDVIDSDGSRRAGEPLFQWSEEAAQGEDS